MQETGGQNLRTPVALGSNLLAEALLDFGQERTNKALAGIAQQGMGKVLNQPAPWAGQDATPDGGSQGQPPLAGAASGGVAGPAGASQPPGQGAPPALVSATASSLTPSPMAGGAGGLADAFDAHISGAPIAGATGPGGAVGSQPPDSGISGAPPADHPVAAAIDAMGTPGSSQPSPQAQMYAGLVKRGMSPVGAAGILGNLVQESSPLLNRANPAEGAVGAANWRGSRAQAEQAYVAAHGGDTMDNQAGFIMSELGPGGPEQRAGTAIMAAPDAASAAQAGLGYERPAGWTPTLTDPSGVSGWSGRLAGAQSALQNFGGSAFSQSNPPAPTQSTASASQTPPAPRPVQVATGPDPSIPSNATPGSAIASPFGSPPPSAQSPGSYQVASNGPVAPPSGSLPGGGAPQGGGFAPGVAMASGQTPSGPTSAAPQGISPKPFPIQPYQKAEWQRLQGLAQQAPQLYLDQFHQYDAALRSQATTPEGLEVSRPNDAGQVTITGKLSGQVYGIQNVPGAMVAAGPKMVMGADGQPHFVEGTGWQQVQSDAPNALKEVNQATGEVRYVPNPAYAPPPQGGHFVQGPGGPQVAPTAGEGWATVPGGPPNAVKQVNQVTGEVRYVANPAYGSPPPGTAINSQGQAGPLPQAPPPSAMDPKAPIPPALAPVFNDLVTKYHADKGYTDYTNSVNAANALEGVLKTASGPNGIVAQAGIDNGLRAMTGLSARLGSVNSLLDHIDIPDQIKGEISKTVGGMYLTPEVLGQVRDMIRGYSVGHLPLAQQQYAQYNDMAHRQGFDLGQTLPQMQPRGNYSWVGGGGGGSDADQSLQNARGAIARGAPRAAVIQRLQAAGVNPAGL